jgi:hypothetical protein
MECGDGAIPESSRGRRPGGAIGEEMATTMIRAPARKAVAIPRRESGIDREKKKMRVAAIAVEQSHQGRRQSVNMSKANMISNSLILISFDKGKWLC